MRCLNKAPDKRITVRYSNDDWCTWHDVAADYATADLMADRFTATLPSCAGGQSIKFAVRFETHCSTWWDNNGGDDYTLLGAACDDRPLCPPASPARPILHTSRA